MININMKMKNENKSRGGYGNILFNEYNYKFLKVIIKILFPPAPFLNCIDNKYKKVIKNKIFQSNTRILDVGSGISKGPGRWLWRNNSKDSTIKIIKMDIIDSPYVDIVGDATSMPKNIGYFNSVILQSIPEHVSDINKLIEESKRILLPGGYIYIEMPFLQGVHGDPFDFWRATPEGLKLLIKPYYIISSGVSGGPIGALIWIVTELFSNILSYYYLNMFIKFMLRWLLSPLRIVDLLLINTTASSKIGCEYYILAQKP
jgi:ubiquinone/menaquinone biosynthesis C-methylase UbiE